MEPILDGGVLEAPAIEIIVDATTPAALPIGQDIFATLRELLAHAHAGKTALAVVLGLILAHRLLLLFGGRIPGPVGAWFSSWPAKWILPQILAALGALSAALATGVPLSFDVLFGSVLLGLAGGGMGSKEQQLARAARAGAEAAATVTDKQAAVETLAGK